MSRLKSSLAGKMTLFIIIDAVCCFFLFTGLNRSIEYFLDVYFEKSAYLDEMEQKYVADLQKYVTNNKLSMEDADRIQTWVKQKKIVYVTIYYENRLLYDSQFTEEMTADQDYADYSMESDYAWASYYALDFTDGTADLFLYGTFEYKFYTGAVMLELLCSFFCFVLAFVFAIRKEVFIIKSLREDVAIIEGGCLTKKIESRGEDELGQLAYGLNQMRISLAENMQMEERLTLANQNLVTGMSHDLRTPLTSLMMYLELLQKKEELDEEQKQYYLKKSLDKATQLKELSDQLFEFFLITRESDQRLDEPVKWKNIFYDYLSDMVMYLEENGYKTVCMLEWTTDEIAVRMDYIQRIFDNITSNILKYADQEQEVVITTFTKEDFVGLCIKNSVIQSSTEVESTNYGVSNIRLMMSKMNGKCEVRESEAERTYTIILEFLISE